MAAWPYSTAAWQRLREAKLCTDPLCEVCIRREVIEPASHVDHVVAIAKGGEPFPPLDQLMSMCGGCHSYKTNMEDRPDRRRKLGSAYKGSAADGGSLDPSDDWSAPSVPSRAAIGTPAAFQGREIADRGPAPPKRKELVAHDSQLESEKWV